MYDLTQIAGALKYGQFDGSKRKAILISYIVLTSLLVASLVALLCVMITEHLNDPSEIQPSNFIMTIISCIIGFLLLPFLFLIIIIKNEKTRKEIILWLQDAVELGAYCEMLLPDYTNAPLNQLASKPVSAKIRVKFKYNGKHFSRDSGYKDKHGNFKNDYQSIWVKYADKSIKILYSPKYDEVIILKNNL